MAKTKTTDRSRLTDAQRETLALAEKGLTATEIARKRKVKPNTIHVMFRSLRAAGFNVGRASANKGSNGGARRVHGTQATRRHGGRGTRLTSDPPAPTPDTATVHGVQAVKAEIEAQQAALKKDRENVQAEAKRLRAEAEKCDREELRLEGEIAAIQEANAALTK